MGVRILLIASVSAAFVVESGRACAQDKDKGSYTSELPAVEVAAPRNAAKPERSRAPVRVVPRVARLVVYPTSPVSTPSTALAVDKVPSTINFVDSGQIQRTNSLNITDALQQSVPAVNVSEVSGNPFQPNVEFRGFVASPVSGTPQGLAVYQNGVRINEAFGDTVDWDLFPDIAINRVELVSSSPV